MRSSSSKRCAGRRMLGSSRVRWLAISWPSSRIRLSSASFPGTLSLMTKKVARAPCRSRTSRMRGVATGSGPSSIVRATAARSVSTKYVTSGESRASPSTTQAGLSGIATAGTATRAKMEPAVSVRREGLFQKARRFRIPPSTPRPLVGSAVRCRPVHLSQDGRLGRVAWTTADACAASRRLPRPA